jgi:hypothetical protein
VRKLPLIAGLVATALALSWQAFTVHYNYGGNWTALFCTGGKLAVPPQLAGEGIYTFPNSNGYDGQFYHYEAHDPFLRKGLYKYMDAPRLRYRRIFVPATAYLLAGGRDRLVDPAFFGVVLLWVFLGAYWLACYTSLSAHHPAWGLCFLLVPATIISIDRLTVDIALAALTVGFALYARHGPPWKLFLVLGCAIFARETGILLLAGYCLYLLSRRLLVRAVLFALAAVPALAWFFYVQPRTAGDFINNFTEITSHSLLPFRLLLTMRYTLPDLLARVLTALDYLATLGIVLAVVLALRFVLKRSPGPEELAGLTYACMTVYLTLFVAQLDPYTYPRVVSPLLVLVAVQGLSRNSPIGLLPAALITPRVLAQLGPQVLGILRGLFSR